MRDRLNPDPLPVRNRFWSPVKGTRQRAAILLALRPQGLTAEEAIERRLFRTPNQLLCLMQRLEYDCGFDIRRNGHTGPRHLAKPVYWIVGRHRWNGSYRAFCQVPDHVPNVRG